jgi:hypothetical protein
MGFRKFSHSSETGLMDLVLPTVYSRLVTGELVAHKLFPCSNHASLSPVSKGQVKRYSLIAPYLYHILCPKM